MGFCHHGVVFEQIVLIGGVVQSTPVRVVPPLVPPFPQRSLQCFVNHVGGPHPLTVLHGQSMFLSSLLLGLLGQQFFSFFFGEFHQNVVSFLFQCLHNGLVLVQRNPVLVLIRVFLCFQLCCHVLFHLVQLTGHIGCVIGDWWLVVVSGGWW